MVLWPLAEPNLPPSAPRTQGGGAQRADEQAVFAAVVYILATGSPWRALPRVFGVSWQNSHRRFVELTQGRFWQRLCAATQASHADAVAVYWADLLEGAARGRLRERDSPAVQSRTGERATRPAWGKPTLVPVSDDFAGRLFELHSRR
jgi:transposase